MYNIYDHEKYYPGEPVNIHIQALINTTRCHDIRKDIRSGAPGSFAVWVVDMVDDTMHWEGFEKISLQNRPQADKKATVEGD